MSKLNLNIKTDLKKQIEKEKTSGKDTRLLNYFDMKDGEKMTILFLPDANGELWRKFSKHGPNLKLPSVGSINCAYKSSGEECPACQKGFTCLNESREQNDNSLKEEAKKWFSKDYTLVQCLVLDSPIEVTESSDGNQVKLMYLPYAIENIIKESVTEGIVPEDELCTTPFVIKKTKNQGGWPSYENSYFARKQITDEELEVFEEFKIEQYNFDDLDLIPDPTTTSEVQEWLDKAEESLTKASRGDGDADQREDVSSSKKASLKDRVASSRSSEVDNEDTRQMNDDIPFDNGTQKEDDGDSGEDEAPASRSSSLRDRLRAARQG